MSCCMVTTGDTGYFVSTATNYFGLKTVSSECLLNMLTQNLESNNQSILGQERILLYFDVAKISY